MEDTGSGTVADQEAAPTPAPTSSNLIQQAPTKVFQYRRDIKPSNIALSATDIVDLFSIIVKYNNKSKDIEFNTLDKSKFENEEAARKFVDDVMRVEYRYKTKTLDNSKGLDVLGGDIHTVPNDLETIFISNATYPQDLVKNAPQNCIDIFLAFEPPSLKIDLLTLPSNPTVNRSIINIYGGNEDWVISTTSHVEKFLNEHKSWSPPIHGSGAYDYALYTLTFPMLIWLFLRPFANVSIWLSAQSVFINVLLGLYAFLAIALCSRFVFQYARWLFPPMVYYRKNRVGSVIHRSVASLIFLGITINALYDLMKWLISVL